ncbi:hypothetical protein BVX99_00495 [bacterium F16]|nr:hypothetical protein BVX99_00495 [bacterium F16]
MFPQEVQERLARIDERIERATDFSAQSVSRMADSFKEIFPIKLKKSPTKGFVAEENNGMIKKVLDLILGELPLDLKKGEIRLVPSDKGDDSKDDALSGGLQSTIYEGDVQISPSRAQTKVSTLAAKFLAYQTNMIKTEMQIHYVDVETKKLLKASLLGNTNTRMTTPASEKGLRLR